MHIAGLLGKSECEEATGDELELLRILTPLLKLYTAKQAIAQTSEGLEGSVYFVCKWIHLSYKFC